MVMMQELKKFEYTETVKQFNSCVLLILFFKGKCQVPLWKCVSYLEGCYVTYFEYDLLLFCRNMRRQQQGIFMAF